MPRRYFGSAKERQPQHHNLSADGRPTSPPAPPAQEPDDMSTPKQVAAATETDQTDPEVIAPYVEADLLADTEQELLEAATAPPKVSAADATTAAMLRIAESMEKMMLR